MNNISSIDRVKKYLYHKESSAFKLYNNNNSKDKKKSLNKSKTILKDITLTLPQTLKKCNPQFNYESIIKPKRVLTKPSEGILNNGYDNINNDLIIHVNDIFKPDPPGSGPKYRVIDLLGQGTFGQVVKCKNLENNNIVAIKVVKNKTAYYNQGRLELKILRLLNTEYDPDDKKHIVRLLDYFSHHQHLCLVFELLSINLYELIKLNQHKGFSINLLRIFLEQIIEAQTVLTEAQCIHCDLKPENILLCHVSSPQIKVIDYGSACYENRTVFSYIQSRFYRSPEVILGVSYTSAIDMWSIGCIGAELFFGLPLFPGNSEYNQISRIINMLGLPPDWMLQQGKKTRKYFTVGPVIRGAKINSNENSSSMFQLKPPERYALETGTSVNLGKKYFKYSTLKDNIIKFPLKPNISKQEQQDEISQRICFAHFLSGLLQLDPRKRWTPSQALKHPFITKEYFDPSWTPPMIRTLPQQISFNSHHQQISLGNSPSMYSPLSSGYHINTSQSNSMPHVYATSLPKDGYLNYNTPTNSPIYTPQNSYISYNHHSPINQSPLNQYNSSYNSNNSYNPTNNISLGSTPTNSVYAKSPRNNSQNQYLHNYRSNTYSIPSKAYSPSKSPFKNTSNISNTSNVFNTSSKQPSLSSSYFQITPKNKTKHRKMRSTGHTIITSPRSNYSSESSTEITPITSPESWNTTTFDFEEDTTSPEKPLYPPNIKIPQISPRISSNDNSEEGLYQSFSQGALSYDKNHTSYLHSYYNSKQ